MNKTSVSVFTGSKVTFIVNVLLQPDLLNLLKSSFVFCFEERTRSHRADCQVAFFTDGCRQLVAV